MTISGITNFFKRLISGEEQLEMVTEPEEPPMVKVDFSTPVQIPPNFFSSIAASCSGVVPRTTYSTAKPPPKYQIEDLTTTHDEL